jgi:hypothetical protein
MFVIPNETVELTDENLVKAMTINEEVMEQGFCFAPKDILKLAKSASIDTLSEKFFELQGEVKAKPMYPNFPTQVMEMDEAEFRMHQLMHYFSTYGLESIFNVEIHKGWLPEEGDTEKTKDDDTLLDAKVLQVIYEDEMYTLPLRRILTKKERMTLPETALAVEAIAHVDVAFLEGISIPFKENLTSVFCHVAEVLPKETATPALAGVCQHSGDAWRCISSYLKSNNYHLRTSQKKLMVKVLEHFPAEDFEANLCLSQAKASSIIRKLEFLSFNRFSRSEAHKEAVRKLRNGELKSWNGRVEYLLSQDGAKALAFIAKRPGMLVRLTARLVRLGISPSDIAKKLCENAGSLSMQTLITLMNFFVKSTVRDEREEAEAVYNVMHQALAAKMSTINTPLNGMKVFIDEGELDFDHSIVEINDRAEEGGYIRSGLAFRIPETVKTVRFFVYWNDSQRVDLDLHAYAVTAEGKEVHVGWDGGYNNSGLTHSGDITHSNAAEYLDINMDDTDACFASFVIHSYPTDYGFKGKPFNKIEESFVGMTAVSQLGENIKLYNPKNCFFSHELSSDATKIRYGEIDVKNRFLRVCAKPCVSNYAGTPAEDLNGEIFSLREYLEMLIANQNATIIESKDEADMVLVPGKPKNETEISIIDSNFFCD